jgi:hypothetical protein
MVENSAIKAYSLLTFDTSNLYELEIPLNVHRQDPRMHTHNKLIICLVQQTSHSHLGKKQLKRRRE